MRLSALIHLVGAIHAIARSERICVLGSSAFLASFPELGEPKGPLELSYDADFLLQPTDEQLAALLHEAVGEGSLFARRTGYYADILRPEVTETLPEGWETRLVKLNADTNSVALSPEDLFVIKLRVGRPKDLELCRHLLNKRLISLQTVRARLDSTRLDDREIAAVYKRLKEISS